MGGSQKPRLIVGLSGSSGLPYGIRLLEVLRKLGTEEVHLCSMRTLSAINHSFADNLLVRAADVTLKERRRLVVMPREAPLHTGQCKLLYEASQLGVIVFPPMPTFYGRPGSIDDMVNTTIGRVLDLFGIDAGLVKRWTGVAGKSKK